MEFNQLITTNADFLKISALKLTSDTADAKDLIQETLYKALTNRENYNLGTNIRTWLYKIMRNIFIHNSRKIAKQNVVCNYSENDLLLCESQLSAVNVAESRLKIQEIQTAVYHLPATFRYPFLL